MYVNIHICICMYVGPFIHILPNVCQKCEHLETLIYRLNITRDQIHMFSRDEKFLAITQIFSFAR